MADFHELDAFPDPAGLRRALRRAVESARPEIRVIAECFLGELSPIDLLAVGGEGELISIRLAEPGGDAAGLTRVLADLAWLRPRRGDFLKLAPGLGIDPSAEPRGWLVARAFGRETLVATDNFPAETIQLWHFRDGAMNGAAGLRLEAVVAEPCDAPRAGTRTLPAALATPSPTPLSASPASTIRPGRRPERVLPLTAPPSPSAFRTGLVDGDLEASRRGRSGKPSSPGPDLPGSLDR